MNLALSDISNYIRNSIRNNDLIYRNCYGGFVHLENIVVCACNYPNLKEITISNFHRKYNGQEEPFVQIRINDFTKEEWIEYQKALLELKEYNESKLINQIKNYKK